MARQDAFQGSLPLLVLKLLARRGPLHGYAIATHIERMSDELLRIEEVLSIPIPRCTGSKRRA
jgi:PadR family transcriptional regulator PadR